MINRLIDMKIPVITTDKTIPYNTKSYAISFLNGMSPNQLTRFKTMLENGIECGHNVANSYGIDYIEFINEVKHQLKVGE